MDPKLAKRIDNLYRNCKQMPMLAILSLFVPIMMLFVVPLCLVYAGQRSTLLKQLDGVDLDNLVPEEQASDSVAAKVHYLRTNGNRFYLPLIVAVGAVAVIGFFVMAS